MAQVLTNYPASLPTPPTTPTKTAAAADGASIHVPLPPAAAPRKGKPGYIGNLTPSQEARLRALWAIAYKFVEMCEADESFQDAVTLEDKFVPPAMKPGAAATATQRRKLKRTGSRSGAVGPQRNPELVRELLSLLPTQERSMDRLEAAALDALDHWTPHMFRITLLHTVKQEHPDELALRFLRRSGWDVVAACKGMGRTIYWRTMEAAIDDDILRLGEGGAAEDERNGQGHARVLGAEFMKLLRSGKGFLHGNDREGRPMTYVRVRLHKPGEHSPESMERYIIYLLEMARLSLRPPVETGTIFLDMSHFRFKNFDLEPLKFILKCAEQYYPESIGLIIVHKAPFGTKALWKLIRHWVSASIADKVRFTSGRKDLFRYIHPSQVLAEHGGEDPFTYEYEEPMADENFKMQNTITRNYLLLERQMLVEQFEDVTKEWVMNAQGTPRAAEVGRRRDRVCAALTANFWELDPYVRARSLYDRRNCLSGTGNLQYHPPKSERRRRDSAMTGGPGGGGRPRSVSSSSGGARSSIMARSVLGGYSSSVSGVGGVGSVGARSSISGAASSGAGTLTTCSILGSPVKEDHFGEMEAVDMTTIADDSSFYSD
ncbi:CRAL/TRIO domain protein [Cordyceps fumosorosea ARSEF 2679]|uniref:CRAL/TRIO domain protein n=1 Tax=Cordyceps fumosorosea (strain ARSEF 2679) TaxID=1081104 RepID=A0A167NCR2_CORFA|nr:CRAL/TRIO domain protein [Cordyceps fumosorosea ARSEF 2679]OAA55403.1 CRAL/TRIO domain protein [Cordyceps fumosorosea ARSEF 2679]